METVFISITDYLLNQSRQIAILFAVVAIICMAIRKKTAHLRYLLWLLILAKCLVPSLITVSLAILPQKPLPQPLPEPPPIREFAPPPETVIMSPGAPLSPPAPTPAPQPSIMAQLAQIPPKTWLSGIWLGGVSLFLLIVLIKAARFNRRLRRQRKPLTTEIQKEFDELLATCRVGLSPRGILSTEPKVYLLDGIGQPFVWGLLRGSIYLPANFGQIGSREHRRGILMHEITHVVRFDAAVNCLQTIAQTIFWFHPLVWLANRNIRAEREKCCDETAIARLSAAPKVYSSAIVDTLIAEYQSTQPIPSLAIAGPIKNIEDRIKTIMKPGKKFYNRPTIIAIATILLLAIAAVPTTIALTHRQPEKPEEFLTKPDVQVEENRPGGTSLQQISFGPVIERVVKEPTEEIIWLFDIDTGKLLKERSDKVPDEVKYGPGQFNWLAEIGADVCASLDEPVYGLQYFDMAVVPNEDDLDLDVSAEKLQRQLSIYKRSTTGAMRAKVPLVYRFKTRENGLGVLQIVGFTKNPKGVKIRYKMLQQKPLQKPDVQVEGEGLSERMPEIFPKGFDVNSLTFRPADDHGMRPASTEEPVRVRWIYHLSPDSSQVELAVVCRPKEDPHSFWDPAGNPIEANSLWSQSRTVALELAVIFEYTNASGGRSYHKFGWPKVDWSKPLKVSYGQSFGKWQEMGVINEGQNLGYYNLTKVEDISNDKTNKIRATMYWRFNLDFGIRLVAVDKNGNEYQMAQAGPFVGNFKKRQQMTYSSNAIGLSKKKLSHFKLQKRPLAWAQFSDFVTEPKKSDVQAEILTDKPPVVLDLDSGKTLKVEKDWPDEYDVGWDNDGGGGLFCNRSGTTKMLPISNAEDFADAVSIAFGLQESLNVHGIRGVLAEDSKYIAVKTSQGNIAVLEIVEYSQSKATVKWKIIEHVKEPDVRVEGEEAVDVEMLTTVIKVEDEQGNPVAGAVITPDGLRAEKGGGHYFWRADRHGEPSTVITNTQGLARLAYPKYADEKLETGSISFLINHTDFCPAHPISHRVDGRAKSIVLQKGATLRVSGYLDSKDHLLTGIYPQLGRGRLYSDSWQQSQEGVFETRQLPPGPHFVRLVYFPEDRIASFSDAIKFDAEKGETYEFNLQLKLGVRLEGSLDETVPRPVRNGRVVTSSHPLNHPHHSKRPRRRFTDPSVDPGYLHWRSWREVKEDGTFIFESLPHGQVELIAICDGYISKNPPDEENNYFGIAQTWPLKAPVTRVELKMKPTASCEIKVLDEQDQPIKGTQVVFSPNVQWHSGGAQIFATTLNSSDILRAGGKVSPSKRAEVFKTSVFQATSDESGIAVVPNLPEGKRHFAVLHPQYQLPAKTGYAQFPRRVAEVELSAGQTARVTVTMQKKGDDFLGAEDLDTRPSSKASASPKAVREIPDAAKWSEGKAMMGTIATAIRAWAAENYVEGTWDNDSLTLSDLGFMPFDLKGTYFDEKNFYWNVSYNADENNLQFTIAAIAPEEITQPAAVMLDQTGKWTIHETLPMKARAESARKLRRLGTALLICAFDYDNEFPQSLESLEMYDFDEELAWARENVEYLGKDKVHPGDGVQPVPLAFDKTMLKEGEGTNVLFSDGHIEFTRPARLKELNIALEAKQKRRAP